MLPLGEARRWWINMTCERRMTLESEAVRTTVKWIDLASIGGIGGEVTEVSGSRGML